MRLLGWKFCCASEMIRILCMLKMGILVIVFITQCSRVWMGTFLSKHPVLLLLMINWWSLYNLKLCCLPISCGLWCTQYCCQCRPPCYTYPVWGPSCILLPWQCLLPWWQQVCCSNLPGNRRVVPWTTTLWQCVLSDNMYNVFHVIDGKLKRGLWLKMKIPVYGWRLNQLRYLLFCQRWKKDVALKQVF